MNIVLLGGAGFIGTNLTLALAQNKLNVITLVGRNKTHFSHIVSLGLDNIRIVESEMSIDTNFDSILQGQDIVYHLFSSTVPTTSNQHISQELISNVVFSSNLFDSCVKCGVNKVVFISSGGTVYGNASNCPLKEETPTNPISSYGVQKITIEKLLYLYNYMYGLDYRIIRLANPYGPYQRPNGILGAISTFTYKILKNEDIFVYGDGSVVRDFIYIDDAIRGILEIVYGNSEYKVFNLGSGYGTSIKEAIETIQEAVGIKAHIINRDSRMVDVPINYLDIERYESCFGKLNPINLYEGVKLTAEFMKSYYFEGKVK